jgi:hypothetical protein
LNPLDLRSVPVQMETEKFQPLASVQRAGNWMGVDDALQILAIQSIA